MNELKPIDFLSETMIDLRGVSASLATLWGAFQGDFEPMPEAVADLVMGLQRTLDRIIADLEAADEQFDLVPRSAGKEGIA